MTTQPSHLPPWRHVLAVVAHPDDESFALGAVIAALADSGSRVDVVCLTRGEASSLGADHADLLVVRVRVEEVVADVFQDLFQLRPGHLVAVDGRIAHRGFGIEIVHGEGWPGICASGSGRMTERPL